MRRCLSLVILLLCGACNLTTGAVGTPTPTGPQVEFVYPTHDTVVAEGSDVQIQLVGRDPDGAGIASIQLMIDGIDHQTGHPVEFTTVPVFTVEMNWLAQSVGFHVFSATAYREDGTASSTVTIRVQVAENRLLSETPMATEVFEP